MAYNKSKTKAELTEDQIQQDITSFFNPNLDPHRTVLESSWFRNILYYMGEQWLSWYSSQGTFGRRYELNVNVPTPVSNIIRDYVRSNKALILNKRYTTTIWPNSSEQDDKDGAQMGIYLLENMDADNDGEIEDIKELTALWLILTGNAFTRTYAAADDGRYVVDLSGKPVVNRGQVVTSVELPFNVRVSTLGTSLNEKDCVGIMNLRCREEVEDIYKVKLTTSENDYELDYQKQLLTMVANVSPWKGRGMDMKILDQPNTDLVVFKEIEYRPTKNYPNGRYVASCCGQLVVNEDHLPIPVDKETGAWEYTLTHFTYDMTPGGFWATGGVEDLLSPQNTINKIDQALEINRDSFGRPILITPASVTLKRLTSKNQGILALQYSGKDSLGAKPAVAAGTPYPQQILEERAIQINVAQSAAGDPKNVLKGQQPTGGASGILVDILRETAEQSHAPDIRRFYRAWNRVQRKRIICAQQVYTSSRLLKIRGKGNEIEVKKFKAADLHGNVDVRLELDSGLSTTNVGKNQFLLDLIKGNFWGNIFEKPQVQRELLKRLGMGGFPEEDNLHRERAEHENSNISEGSKEAIKNLAFPGLPVIDTNTQKPIQDENGVISYHLPPTSDPVFRVDNHLIHIQVHEQLILSREFNSMDEKVQAIALGHLVMHQQAWKAMQVEQMAMEQELNQKGNPGQVKGNPTSSASGSTGAMM